MPAHPTVSTAQVPFAKAVLLVFLSIVILLVSLNVNYHVSPA